MSTWRNSSWRNSLTTAGRRRARRVAVAEKPPFTGAAPDYADAFAVTRSPADPRWPERWARDGFERLPMAIRRPGLLIHRWILGFSLGPWDSANHIFGWPIVSSEPEFLHLEARSALLRGHMVWRLQEEQLVMTTFLQYEMQRTATVVWAVLVNFHRRAPYLLEMAAVTPAAADGLRSHG